MQGLVSITSETKAGNTFCNPEAPVLRRSANQNIEKPTQIELSSFPGISGQSLAGSGALVFEGELLHIA